MSQKISGPKGMNDILPPDIEIWQFVERIARELFSRYGYQEVRTPMVEETALFIRGIGEETEAVGKQMYTFEDRGGRSLSLRPEGTASAVRSYIEHSVFNQEPLTRWFYLGPMFRYERMKTGRYRQFHQIGAEAFGAKEPAQDVEVMEMVVRFLEKLELGDIQLHINSLGDDTCRPVYQKRLVEHFSAHQDELCDDCKVRLEKNPLRILDCKVERCQQIAQTAPNILETLCEPCKAHFAEVQRQLTVLGIPFTVNPKIVRGLDYYTRTAFEFIAAHPALGTASAVGGGGRYDKLVKSLGGPEVPAVGFGLGLDRICLLLKETGRSFAGRPDLFIATVDPSTQDEALKLISSLRREGFWIEFDTRGGSLKSQMKRADKTRARYALVIGGDEVASNGGQLKPMAGGEPTRVEFKDLGSFLARK